MQNLLQALFMSIKLWNLSSRGLYYVYLIIYFAFSDYLQYLFKDDFSQASKEVRQGMLRTIKNYKLGQNICRLFHVLVEFLFTPSQKKLDYHHKKVNVGVAKLNTLDLKKLGNF